jgi:hypothetical protein
MRGRPAGATLLLAAAAIATLHAPRAGGDAIQLGRRGARGAGLAWVYHDGRIFRQNVDEDPVVVGRLLQDGAPASDEADSSVAMSPHRLRRRTAAWPVILGRLPLDGAPTNDETDREYEEEALHEDSGGGDAQEQAEIERELEAALRQDFFGKDKKNIVGDKKNILGQGRRRQHDTPPS